jgi:hypothetical protein
MCLPAKISMAVRCVTVCGKVTVMGRMISGGFIGCSFVLLVGI